MGENTNNTNQSNSNGQQQQTEEEKENALKLGIYLSLKNLYDKWISTYGDKKFELLTPIDEDMYFHLKSGIYDRNSSFGKQMSLNAEDETSSLETSNFTNFLFVDSYFNDISNSFMCNPQILYQLIKNHVDGSANFSMYKAMDYFAQKNDLMFRAMPMFNNFYEKDAVLNAFTPYTNADVSKNGADDETFVCMYTSELSKTSTDGDENSPFKTDYFEFTNPDGSLNSETISTLFSESRLELDENGSAVYDENFEKNIMVPAFGVSYGMQNQSFFKNVSVNMDTPKMTDYSIAALFNLGKITNENEMANTHTVAQDAYTIFSNHSYNCTVEMLGDMQIMPLMYFQLNNIPLFKGVYQIINVEHSIKGGAMTTKFSGVRMSNYTMPYVSNVLSDSEIISDFLNMAQAGLLSEDFVVTDGSSLYETGEYLKFDKDFKDKDTTFCGYFRDSMIIKNFIYPNYNNGSEIKDTPFDKLPAKIIASTVNGIIKQNVEIEHPFLENFGYFLDTLAGDINVDAFNKGSNSPYTRRAGDILVFYIEGSGRPELCIFDKSGNYRFYNSNTTYENIGKYTKINLYHYSDSILYNKNEQSSGKGSNNEFNLGYYINPEALKKAREKRQTSLPKPPTTPKPNPQPGTDKDTEKFNSIIKANHDVTISGHKLNVSTLLTFYKNFAVSREAATKVNQLWNNLIAFYKDKWGDINHWAAGNPNDKYFYFEGAGDKNHYTISDVHKNNCQFLYSALICTKVNSPVAGPWTSTPIPQDTATLYAFVINPIIGNCTYLAFKNNISKRGSDNAQFVINYYYNKYYK